MLDYTIFGESHGPAVGVLVTGAAPGLPVDREIIRRELDRRAPGGRTGREHRFGCRTVQDDLIRPDRSGEAGRRALGRGA